MTKEELKKYIEIVNSTKSPRLLKQREKIKKQEWFFSFENKIPNHWLEVNFMDVTWLITCGVAKKPIYVDEGIPFLSAQNTRPFKTNLNKIKYISQEAFEKLTVGGKPEKNDVLYTRVGNCGEAASIPYDFDFGVYVSLTLIKPIHELINHKFLVGFLNSNFGKIQANTGAIGIGLKNLNVENVRKYKIPLPPLVEQKAIVKRIEELFSSLDSGIADLNKAQDQLKIYRQAVLKKAFEGELTKEWREKNQIKFDWKIVKLNEICEHITDGDHQAPPKADSGIPFITISNINKSSKQIDFTKTYFVGLDYYTGLNEKRTPKKGDVLYTVTGSFGIPVLVNFEKKFCFQRHIGLLRPKDDLINQKWLFHILQSQSVYKQAYEKATGTAQKTVALSTLRNITVSVCSLKEQYQIIKEIESRLSVCDKVEKDIAKSLEKALALRQSILKKAFEGTLLSEDEIANCKADKDYEPASVLLKKIKKEKLIK
jgi:type I restriction enzyme S subunit